MGHASITTTLNLYGHLYPGEMDRYADRLNEATGMSDATDDVAKMRPDDDANRIGYDVTIGVIWGFGGALERPETNLLIRGCPFGHPAPFRSVRDLGLVSAGCPGGPGLLLQVVHLLEDLEAPGRQQGQAVALDPEVASAVGRIGHGPEPLEDVFPVCGDEQA
jgi:hypothetical protein